MHVELEGAAERGLPILQAIDADHAAVHGFVGVVVVATVEEAAQEHQVFGDRLAAVFESLDVVDFALRGGGRTARVGADRIAKCLVEPLEEVGVAGVGRHRHRVDAEVLRGERVDEGGEEEIRQFCVHDLLTGNRRAVGEGKPELAALLLGETRKRHVQRDEQAGGGRGGKRAVVRGERQPDETVGGAGLIRRAGAVVDLLHAGRLCGQGEGGVRGVLDAPIRQFLIRVVRVVRVQLLEETGTLSVDAGDVRAERGEFLAEPPRVGLLLQLRHLRFDGLEGTERVAGFAGGVAGALLHAGGVRRTEVDVADLHDGGGGGRIETLADEGGLRRAEGIAGDVNRLGQDADEVPRNAHRTDTRGRRKALQCKWKQCRSGRAVWYIYCSYSRCRKVKT